MPKIKNHCFDYDQFCQNYPWSSDTIWDHLLETYPDRFPRKRSERVRENLKLILEACFKLSHEVGFASMSMRDLSRESGMSLGGLYNYFPSKEAIANTITDVLLDIALKWLPSLIERADGEVEYTNAEALERLLRGHIYLSERLGPWFHFVFMESHSLCQQHKEAARQAELTFQDLLTNYCSEYSGSPLIGAHLAILVQDWHVKRWKYSAVSVDDFADSVWGMVSARV